MFVVHCFLFNAFTPLIVAPLATPCLFDIVIPFVASCLLDIVALFIAPCLFDVATLYLFDVIAPYLFNIIVPLIILWLLNVVIVVVPTFDVLAEYYYSYCCFLFNDATPLGAQCCCSSCNIKNENSR